MVSMSAEHVAEVTVRRYTDSSECDVVVVVREQKMALKCRDYSQAAYPMMLKGTYTRDVSFTKEGWACSANNPIPVGALEDGVAELICVDATGAVPKSR